MSSVRQYLELKKLDERVKTEAADNTDAVLTAFLAPTTTTAYNRSVRANSLNNATRTAVDVYIIKAKTGKLPNGLPPDSPKDPFSDRDFEYEKTKDGFVLRCQAKDLEKDEIHQYEFKIPK
jgi:hypothetical protein